MSGNPFRKQTAQDNPPEPSRPKGKTKKVKFVSPVASPQEPPSLPRFPTLEELDNGPKSPPPKGLADAPDAVDTRALLRGDVTAGGAIDLRANEREEATTAGRLSASQLSADFQLSQPPVGRRGPPANPFARTLATMDADAAAGKKADADSLRSKPAMDVDAFKRMLLGDKADAPVNRDVQGVKGVATANTATPPQVAPRAGADTHERPGSPDSLDSLEDASTEDEEDEESNGVDAKAVPTAASGATLQSQDGPKTVSFDDFDNDTLEPAQVEDSAQTRSSRSGSLLQANTELNAQPPVSVAQASMATPEASETLLKKPTLPPPPPTSRRQGPARPLLREAHARTPSFTDTDLHGPGRPKPPPPRAPAPRVASREARGVGPSSDSTRTMSSDTVPTLETSEGQDSAAAAKLRPPPPPSRNAAKQTPLAVRRMSSSSSNIVLPRRTSPALPAGTPPPPPPRRGDGKRSSLEDRRPSGSAESRSSSYSTGMDRRDSISSLQATPEGNEPKPEPDSKPFDMLADLDAFQREVDALRAKALRGQ